LIVYGRGSGSAKGSGRASTNGVLFCPILIVYGRGSGSGMGTGIAMAEARAIKVTRAAIRLNCILAMRMWNL
jgi:hypothetical protein